MAGPIVDILMYHSVSDTGGATAISPGVFAMQMQTIADAGLPVLTMDDYLAGRDGHAQLPPRAVVITFDDGFQDFADVAWPILSRHSFHPIVYLPTGFVGRAEGWQGIGSLPRPLMGWDQIRALAAEGVLFGSHTVSHPNLNSLADPALTDELGLAKRAIEDQLSHEVRHFAPPYGLANAHVRDKIAALHRTSAGTRLGQAGPAADLTDLPRLEMFYFTDADRWRRHLAGQGGVYLARRKVLRAVRGVVMNPWRGL